MATNNNIKKKNMIKYRRFRRLAVIVISASLIVGSEYSIYSFATNTKIRRLQSELEKTATTLEETQAELDANNEELDSVINTCLEDKKQIQILQDQLDEKTSELESARREIEDIERTVIFNENDVTQTSHTTVTHMKKALKGTALYDYAELFCYIEEEYGINAYLLPAIAAQESAWGESNRAVEDNNLTGLEVYQPVSRGYVSDSKEDNLLKTAKILKEQYLSVDGSCYNGKSVYDINTKYCYYIDQSEPDYRWTDGVVQIANQLIEKANE